jgi:hypothetical protein
MFVLLVVVFKSVLQDRWGLYLVDGQTPSPYRPSLQYSRFSLKIFHGTAAFFLLIAPCPVFGQTSPLGRRTAFLGVFLYKVFHARHAVAKLACMEVRYEKRVPESMPSPEALPQTCLIRMGERAG